VSSARDGRTRPPLTAALLAGLLLGALWIVSGAIARLTGSDIVLTRLLSFVGIGPLQSHAWLLPGASGRPRAGDAPPSCAASPGSWDAVAQGVGRAHAPPSTAAVSSARDGRTRPPLTAALLAGLLLGALWIVSGA
ncbi:hypothetical protein CTI14_42845, partial [Methylobacterium radiotolerans]